MKMKISITWNHTLCTSVKNDIKPAKQWTRFYSGLHGLLQQKTLKKYDAGE